MFCSVGAAKTVDSSRRKGKERGWQQLRRAPKRSLVPRQLKRHDKELGSLSSKTENRPKQETSTGPDQLLRNSRPAYACDFWCLATEEERERPCNCAQHLSKDALWKGAAT